MSIKASLGWTAASQIFGSLIQFASSVVLARTLLPEEVGVFAVGAATTGILTIIQQLGLPALIIRSESVSRDLEATAFTVNLAFSLIVAVGIAVAGSLATTIFNDSRVEQVMYWLALCPLALSVSFLPAAQLERAGDFKTIAIAATISSIAVALSTLGFLSLGMRYMSLAYAQVIGSLVTSAVLIWSGRRFSTIAIGIKEWRHIAAFSSRIVLIGGSYTLSQRIAEMSLARLTSIAALGLYNRASSINVLIWGNVHYVVGRVFLVDFARLYREKQDLSSRYKDTAASLIALMWPAYFGVALLSRQILSVIYGDRWIGASTTLSLLCIGSAISTSLSLSGELFMATGNVAAQARLEVKRAIFSTLLFVLGAFISLEAAAATRIIDSVVGVLIYGSYVKSMTGLTSTTFFRLYKTGSILTLLALTPSALALAFTPAMLQHIPGLAAVIVAGILLWVLGLHFSAHPLLRPLHRMIETRRSRTA